MRKREEKSKTSIIKKIEIKKFRSFDQVEIETSDLNIYSGRNNSGKSNILRALNLFFNQKSNYDAPYDHGVDFNKAFGGVAGGRRAIEITIHFCPCGEGALKDDFSIKRIFTADNPIYEQSIYSANDKIQEMLDKRDGNIVRQFTRFLNKIEYIYIPAVRDKKFIKTLLLNFETIIRNDVSGDAFDAKIKELSEILSKKSDGISRDFEKFIGLPAKASLSSNTQDVLGAINIDVLSGIQIKNKKTKKDGGGKIVDLPINLFSSGDGVVMSYLVFFLAFLTKKTNKKYIWGFEEPENSLEFSKVQGLARDFYDNFSRTAQIFVTTHSPAFIDLRERQFVEFYRVYIAPQRKEDKVVGRPDKRISRVQKLEGIRQLVLESIGNDSDVWEVLNEELHLVEQAEEIQEAVKKLEDEKKEYEKKIQEVGKINKRIMKLCPSKIFICEDEKSVPLWRALLERNGIDGVEVMASCGAHNDGVEKWIGQQSRIEENFCPMVWREVDRDGFMGSQAEAIEKKYGLKCLGCKKYKYSMLPVNEIENFILLANNLVVSDEDFACMRDEITRAFERTINANLNNCNKYVPGSDDLFPAGNSNKRMDVFQKMRDEALQDWRRYMPGKDILSKKGNIDTLGVLKEMEIEDLPQELKDYLEEVKKFFGE